MSIGIAFSGGGIKAAFHIGVLAALEEENIDIEYVSGTSSGAIVASLYAAGFSSKEILRFFYYYAKKIVVVDKKSVIRSFMNIQNGSKCINKCDNLEYILYNIFKTKNIYDICDIKKKIAICCVDLNSSKEVYFLNKMNIKIDGKGKYVNNGRLYKIVKASAAYPVLFEPVIYKNQILVDGGVKNNLPVSILKKMGAEKIIAVNSSNSIKKMTNLSILNVGLKCISIMVENNCENEKNIADVLIQFNSKVEIGILDFKYINMLVNLGYIEAQKYIKQIKNNM